MAFLCPVRIRSNTGSGARKKKQNAGDPGKKRSFLSATVNSLIGDHHSEPISPGIGESRSEGGNSGGPPTGPGRITGSSSIETLVRVGIEKEAGKEFWK